MGGRMFEKAMLINIFGKRSMWWELVRDCLCCFQASIELLRTRISLCCLDCPLTFHWSRRWVMWPMQVLPLSVCYAPMLLIYLSAFYDIVASGYWCIRTGDLATKKGEHNISVITVWLLIGQALKYQFRYSWKERLFLSKPAVKHLTLY